MNALLCMFVLLCQDDTAKAKELLAASAAALKDAPAIAFDCQASWTGMEVKQKIKFQIKRPVLARIEATWEGQDYLYVLDGKTMWMYQKATNEYMKSEQEVEMLDQLGAGPIPSLFLNQGAGRLLEGVEKIGLSQEKLGEDECRVLSWSSSDTEFRLWIDAKKAIRKYGSKMKFGDESYEQTVEYGVLDLAPKLAADAFVFTPPKDAKEMKQGGDEESLLEEGADAPDFEATDLEGKPVKLSDFKGKVVLLNFWFYD